MGGNCTVVIRDPGSLVKAVFMQSKEHSVPQIKKICTHAKQARNFSVTLYINI